MRSIAVVPSAVAWNTACASACGPDVVTPSPNPKSGVQSSSAVPTMLFMSGVVQMTMMFPPVTHPESVSDVIVSTAGSQVRTIT